MEVLFPDLLLPIRSDSSFWRSRAYLESYHATPRSPEYNGNSRRNVSPSATAGITLNWPVDFKRPKVVVLGNPFTSCQTTERFGLWCLRGRPATASALEPPPSAAPQCPYLACSVSVSLTIQHSYLPNPSLPGEPASSPSFVSAMPEGLEGWPTTAAPKAISAALSGGSMTTQVSPRIWGLQI